MDEQHGYVDSKERRSRPSISFLSVSLQLCHWLPPDTFSPVCPCLKLIVIVARLVELSIWALVLRQETFTPLICVHAGRTQAQCIETLGYDALCNRSRLSPVIANVS